MSVEENIRDVIQRKIWSVEQLLSQAGELAARANELPEEARKSIPVFSGGWSEDNVKKHLEKIGVAIRDPLRYKNRKLLEDIGVRIKGISEETIDDSAGINDVVRLFGELREFNEIVTNILSQKDILAKWLQEGIDKAKKQLKEILDAKTAFQRIFQAGSDENLRSELIRKCIENAEFITSAEDIISKLDFISEFKIATAYSEEFDEFQQTVQNVYDELLKLQEEYGIQKEEIGEQMKGRLLRDVHKLLKKKQDACSIEKSKLLEEWKMYSAALKSIGGEVPELPHGLYEMEEEAKQLKSRCLRALGEEGFKLLKFLKGEENFPNQISKDGIKKALEILRPLFVKFLREEG